MKVKAPHRALPRNLLVASALLTAAWACHAQTAVPATAAQANDPYAVCEDGLQDRQACRTEVDRTRNLKTQESAQSEQEWRANALRRCSVHQDPQAKLACEDRVLGVDNTQTQGSALEGGIIREQRLTVPAPESAPEAAPQSAPALQDGATAR